MFWEEKDVNSPTEVSNWLIYPLVSKVAVKLNVSYWQLDSLIFLFQLVVFLMRLSLVLGGRVIMGAVYRANEYVENPFFDPCIEKCPSKTLLLSLLSLIKFIHNLNTFS